MDIRFAEVFEYKFCHRHYHVCHGSCFFAHCHNLRLIRVSALSRIKNAHVFTGCFVFGSLHPHRLSGPCAFTASR